MGKPAARITDMHVCPMVNPGPAPHVGGPVAMGSPNVLTGKLPQARVGDMAVCVGPPDVIAMGSTGVFVNKKPAARLGDQTAHGGTIVAGLPTVLIGETKGGGGGGAGAMFAGATMLQFAEYAAQVQVLIDAHRSGAPFCEICFKNAVAKLKAPAPAPAAKAPAASPASTLAPASTQPATPPPSRTGPTIGPASKTCEVTALKVTCSHGRAAGPENILCVVPGGAMWSDTISGQLTVKDGCGDHPAWSVSGATSKSGAGASLSFAGTAASKQPSPYVTVTPAPAYSAYQVSAQGCRTSAQSVEVQVYPPDELGLSIDFMKSFKSIKEAFTSKGFFGKDDEWDFLHGSISFSTKWKEAKDWRCYNESKISGGFSPLLAGSLKVPFYKPVPPPLDKVVDVKVYVVVKGSCQIQASLAWEHWPYPMPGGKQTVWKTNVVEGGGEFRFGVGASASLGESTSVTIEGTSGYTLSISPAHQDYPAAKYEQAFGDGKFDVTIEWPWAIEMKFSVALWPGWTDEGEWRFDETKG